MLIFRIYWMAKLHELPNIIKSQINRSEVNGTKLSNKWNILKWKLKKIKWNVNKIKQNQKKD